MVMQINFVWFTFPCTAYRNPRTRLFGVHRPGVVPNAGESQLYLSFGVEKIRSAGKAKGIEQAQNCCTEDFARKLLYPGRVVLVGYMEIFAIFGPVGVL